jgi:nitrate reductase NapD
MNVSSLIIKTSPEHLEKVIEKLRASRLCEVFFHDSSGNIVVTIEGRDTGEEMDRMKAIEKLPHVLGAALVYSYSEEELDRAAELLARGPGGPVPDELKNA